MSERPGSSRLPDLGPRGEGWVALQFTLLIAVVGAAALGPRWRGDLRAVGLMTGIVLMALGAMLALWGSRGLGAALTPLPRPRDDASFRDAGAYRLVRHPIYGGVLLLAVGAALLSSPLALVPAACLGLLFEGKRQREEGWLTERYPEYACYRRRVHRRFVPYVW